MCGFYNIIDRKKKFNVNERTIDKYLKHRGPDYQKKFKYYGKLNFFCKFYRLSILDRSSKSNQPFKFKNLVLTFNGEIYNYIEIKDF